jgi:xylulokinase
MNEGDGFVSLGTSGVVLTARSGFAPMADSAVHSFCHAVPQQWYQMGVVLAATDAMNWLGNITGASPQELTEALGDAPQVPANLMFYPYLSGERTPHNDSAVRAGFVGLDIAHTRADMTRAVMEGVCFALRDSLEALRQTGAAPTRLLAIGGGTGSVHWVRMLASVLNLPLDLPQKGEFGAALGAARLAICGVTKAPPATIMTKPPVAQTIAPEPSLAKAYDAAYTRYRTSFPEFKALQ